MAIRGEVSFSLKDQLFNERTVSRLADAIAQAYRQAGKRFQRARFLKAVLEGFAERELKARIDWIVEVLGEFLPSRYEDALDLLEAALPPPLDPTLTDDDFGEFIWVVPGEYAARHGCTVEQIDRALAFLDQCTRRFSAENAIRPFLSRFPDRTLEFVRRAAASDNYHVRRLASEGIRPLLPWSERVVLPSATIVDVLDRLYADSTRYVTRSVCNTLNDISKSEPDVVLATLERWQRSGRQDSEEMAWMTRHALRTLLKRAYPPALEALGYAVPANVTVENVSASPTVDVGESFEWSCELVSAKKQRLLVALHIHFLKANGRLAPKVFNVRDAQLAKGQRLQIAKRQPFKPITTRVLYPGRHRAELVVNGAVVAEADFELIDPAA